MKKLALGALFVGLIAACGSSGNKIKVVDSNGDTGPMVCSPLTQMGCQANEKCTWIVDATTPMYVGHIGCEPAGSAAIGGDCMYGAAGATGYDNCVAGAVCSAFSTSTLGTTGKCKQICDNQGSDPMCDTNHVCVTYSILFKTGATTPHAAGVCDLACDPLDDNDFDGSNNGSSKPGHTCDTGSNDWAHGCYGYPSFGTLPKSGWSCGGDGGYGSGSGSGSAITYPDLGFRNHVQCTAMNGCADTDGTIYTNSCNQGYIPLFYDHTGVTVEDCTALCAPLDCYSGNCGNNNLNRFGAMPHRCASPDALPASSFNTAIANGPECEYEWIEEIDTMGSGGWLPSKTSNTVGFCFDHSQFRYDSNGDGAVNGSDANLPACQDLQIVGSGSDPSMPNSYWGAQNLGCVNSSLAGLGSGVATGKAGVPVPPGFGKNVLVERPRFLYHRVMRAE